MKRGELWTVAGGVCANKPRPALILQDDRFDATDSVTVCPLTKFAVDAPLVRIEVPPNQGNGLHELSFIMVDKTTTTRRASVRERLGIVSASQMVQVERSLLVFLGLAD